MTTLTEFLLARIAEDENEIGELAPGVHDDSAGPNGIGWAEVGAISDVLICSNRRARAECRAKRRQIEHLISFMEGDYAPWNEDQLQMMAEVYDDHPDYREEWRP